MLAYSNSITCSVSGNKNEFILVFRQNHPVVSATGEVTDNISETVSEVVLNRDGIAALKNLIDAVLTDQNPEV